MWTALMGIIIGNGDALNIHTPITIPTSQRLIDATEVV
jgi:hypothetical protein